MARRSARDAARSADGNRPLRILRTIGFSGREGARPPALRIASCLRRRGHEVTIATVAGSANAQMARDEGLDVVGSITFEPRFVPWRYWEDLQRARRLIRRLRPDIVHVGESMDTWRMALALLLEDRPAALVRTRERVVPVWPHPFNRWLHNRLVDRLIVTAEKTRRLWAALPGFKPEKIERLPEGIDVERFRPRPRNEAVRAALGLPADAVVVGAVARLDAIKGHGDLLQAAKQLRARHPRMRVVCVGRGPYEEAIRRQIEDHGLAATVILAGHRRDIAEVLSTFDVFVLASIGSEGMSRATLEAMAAGLPVVATTVGSLPDIVVPDRTGLLVPPQEPAALAEAIGALLSDPDKRARFGAAGRRRAVAEYADEVIAARLERLYRDVLRVRRRVRP